MSMLVRSTKRLHGISPSVAAWAIQPSQLLRYSSWSIPFDTQPFALGRFEPCCPESGPAADNGFVACQKHPLPPVLGKKIDMVSDMVAERSTQRHVVMCVGSDSNDWSRAKVEAVAGGPVCEAESLHGDYLRRNRHNPPPPTDKDFLMTVCDRPPSSPPTCDAMVFPDFISYPHIDPTQLAKADFRHVLESLWYDPSNQLPALSGTHQKPLDDDILAVVLVCTHERRDMRCGKLGPLIVDAFRRGLAARDADLQGKRVLVHGTSHFGGHKFAGNLIIHQRSLGGQMYGNVRACHVDGLIDRHLIHGKIIKELWRGQVTPPLSSLPSSS
ncbi:hypothetical protein DM01DRAFT_1332711 [Hesseltinella vesiculosa]|uniref:Sucraseferredoxin-like protein n=1 Tax=Hesseltinella vesiculosa TaxID=101127 RepID=A0A1X2GSX6_9FUNG|nr:hypothetical protein DM01DRAFT_1332711 [Hesseltinella vesiculosa]